MKKKITYDPKKCLEILYSGKLLDSVSLRILLKKGSEILETYSNVLEVEAPLVIVGDVHGQWFDLIEIMNIVGRIPDTNFLFLGDYINRGSMSVEVISLLVCLKVLYPSRIHLLRGDHESRQLQQVYGFYEECKSKYREEDNENNSIWKDFNNYIFDRLPLSAVVSDTIFCVHGGLSPSIDTLDHIRQINRFQEVPYEGGFCDILLSNPESRKGWGCAPRATGYVFGEDITIRFNWINNFEMIARSHQLVMDGYDWMHGGRLITIFSAPNYCNRAGNSAAVMMVEKDALSFEVIQFDNKNTEEKTEKNNKIVHNVFKVGGILSSKKK